MNDSNVRVRKVRKSVRPNQAIDRRTRFPFASSTTTLIGSAELPDALLELPGDDGLLDEAPEPEDPPDELPADPEVLAARPAVAADVAGDAGEDVTGSTGLSECEMAGDDVLSSLICCVMSDAAGLADNGSSEAVAGLDFEIGESFDSRLSTLMLAVGFPLDRTALAI